MMNAEYKVVQGFEPKPEGGDAPYWMVLDADGKVNFVADTEEEAFQHLSLLKAGLVYTPAHSLAPVAAPEIEDVLAVKNAEIARLQAENARLQQVTTAVRTELGLHIYFGTPVDVSDLQKWFDALFSLKKETTAAPQEAVTLTEDEIEWLAKHSASNGDFYCWSRAEKPETMWKKLWERDRTHDALYDEFYLRTEYDTAANRAAIEARRKELGLVD